MKKFLVMICAAMLCVCCFGLAACGGGSASGSAAASGSASASESASSAAQPTFVGDWKLAAMEYQSIKIAGDFSALVGEDVDISMTVKDDGTGTMVYQGESGNFTWTQKDESTITIKPENDGDSLEATLKDGAVFMNTSIEGQELTVIFTPDGTYAEAVVIDTSKATAIKSVDELVGSWTLCGVTYNGASMYGDPADLAAISGTDNITVTFDKNGKVSLMGSEADYVVDAEGAYVTESGLKLPIKALDGKIVLDLSPVGTNMTMVFAK